MFYANYDENTGEILGFYNDEIHQEIPEPYIELTKKEWGQAVSGSYRVVNGVLEEYAEPEYELTKSERIEQAQKNYSTKFEKLREQYIAADLNNDYESMGAIKEKYAFLVNDFNNLIGFLNGEVPRNTYGSSSETDFCPVCGSVLNENACTKCRWKVL